MDLFIITTFTEMDFDKLFQEMAKQTFDILNDSALNVSKVLAGKWVNAV